MVRDVTAFTDTYLPTVNGVTYTIDLWRSRWNDGYGRMRVVYPRSDGHAPRAAEIPVASVPVPGFRGHRLGAPVIPSALAEPSSRSSGGRTSSAAAPLESDVETDIVHVHSPFALGVAGLRFAARADAPVVATYHTVLGERIEHYLAGSRVAGPRVVAGAKAACRRYERRFYDAVDLVTAPTVDARRRLRRAIDPATEIEIVSNGIDTDAFRPVETDAFAAAYGIDADAPDRDRPILGYAGRHGPEKHLEELLEAVAEWDRDATVLLAGDGPCRSRLENRARELGCDARFLGFLPREALPAFYSLLDAFVFPGRIETQGLVALEAAACGTPVVAVDAGALRRTVLEGETGYHYPPGDVAALRDALERTLAERDRLRDLCLRRRDAISVDRTLERLASVYERVAANR